MDDTQSNRQDRLWRKTTWIAAIVVGFVAVLFRLPFCGESFWLDELHSAWAVNGRFSDVALRAAQGNQTTGYFHMLWVWSGMVGTGEVAMRMSSVLATSIASSLLVIGVYWRTDQIWAGVIAGLMLAVDPNGIFFGTELRPYAFVMLYAVLAVWAMMVWLDGDDVKPDRSGPLSTGSFGGARWRLAMLFWICVSALVHPTSLGVLSLLVPLALLVALATGRLRLWRADFVACLVVAATLGALAMSSLPDSWERRDLWKSFGQATNWWQLWSAWSWVPIVVVPLALAVMFSLLYRLIASTRKNVEGMDQQSTRWWIGLIPGAVAIAGTATFFIASYYEWVPMWHRRYFVAALPLLAWTAGELSALAMNAIRRTMALGLLPEFRPRPVDVESPVGSMVRGIVVTMIVIGFMLWHQNTLARLVAGDVRFPLRGEQWREAVSLAEREMQGGESVWLDTQLIEARFMRYPLYQNNGVEDHDPDWEYLGFPLRGPYALQNVVPVSCAEDDSWIRQHLATLPARPTTVWLVSRSGKQSVDQFVERLNRFRSVAAEVRFSGRPMLVKLSFR